MGPPHLRRGHERDERGLACQLAWTRILAEPASAAEVLPRLARSLGEGLGWDYVVFWRVDPRRQVLRFGDRWRAPATEFDEFDALTSAATPGPGDGLPGRVWTERRPISVADLATEEKAIADVTGRTQAAARAGLRVALAFPVQVHYQVLGVVESFAREAPAADGPLLDVASALGSQMGQFLEQKRFEERGLTLFRAVEQSASLVAVADAAGRIEFVNPEFTRVTGYDAEEAVGRPLLRPRPDDMPAALSEALQTAMRSGHEWRGEFQGRKKDGAAYWTSAKVSPVRDSRGALTHFVAIQEDVTLLKQAEESLRLANEDLERRVHERTEELVRVNTSLMREVAERLRIDRARRALSRSNQVLVRSTCERQFLEDLCRVIVDDAHYRLCWVGFAEDDQRRTVRPVAHAGYEEGYLQTADVTWSDTPRGRGPAGGAIRTGEVVVVRDVARDPAFAPWRKEALKRGYASVIGIPLSIGPRTRGSLTIYASEPDAFDEPEVALLRELADDLGFGVLALRDRVERERAEERSRRANDDLERTVADRTAELLRANAQLTQEVADRKRAQEALSTSEQLYRQLTEGTRDAIVVADESGKITLFNPAAQTVFGYAESEAVGRPLTILMPAETAPLHERGLRRFLETRQPRLVGRSIELVGMRKGGEQFPLELSLSAIDLPDRVVLLGAIRDLTERQRLHTMIVHAEKLASLGLVSAGVAHEINNPLAYTANNLAVLERDFNGLIEVVDLYEAAHAELAATRPDLAEALARRADEVDLPYIREHFSRILTSTRKGIKRVSDIVQNLRKFARLDEAVVDQLDLREAVAGGLELISYQLTRKNITIELVDEDAPVVVCAPAQINQVVLNLMVNAMQAIEANGRASGKMTITTRRDGTDAVLEIADDGCGIPADKLLRIFDPFFTTKPAGQGTGLGLAISQGIVSDHGGRIEVDSTLGQGTCFRVYLPAAGKPRGPAH